MYSSLSWLFVFAMIIPSVYVFELIELVQHYLSFVEDASPRNEWVI